MKLKSRKVMIVCSERCDDLKTHLVCEGWMVIWVYDAKTSLARVRREHFDLVVLISTGNEMDLMETFFNLRDIRRSLPVIIVHPDDSENAVDRAFPMLSNTGLQSVQGLDGLVSLLSGKKAQRNARIDQVVRSHRGDRQ
jgi:PleD family two-component response regulator